MEIKDLLREPLKDFKPYTAGGSPIKVREGITEVYNLNANENQMGPSPKAVAAMQEAAKVSNYYPFTFSYQEGFRAKLAKRLGFESENIMIAGGSSGIITALNECFINPGDEVVTCVPTYDSYRANASRYGAKFIGIPLKDHRFDLDAMLEAITEKTKLAIIVNPNNPTGTIVSNEELDAFMEKVPEHVIVVLDEAYLEWIDLPDYESGLKYIKEGKNIVVLKTFSKLYGMAGVRVGYGVMPKEICQYVRGLEFSVGASRIALAGMDAALDDEEFLPKSVKNNTQGRNYLMEELKKVGFDVITSYASFVYFHPKGIESQELVRRVGEEGVLIRPYGEYTRVSVGLPHQNERFIEVLHQVLGK